MAQFVLTARYDINRSNQFHLDKGTQLNITIPMAGISTFNLFNNSRCKDALLNQFKLQGINIPASDMAFYSLGCWDVKMR